MDYNYYLLNLKEHHSDNNQCLMNGTCSTSPTLIYLHEFIISYLQELAFYLLSLKKLGINNEQIKNDILDVTSGMIINIEYNETQFFNIVTKIYANLTQAKELYMSVCKRNGLKTEIFNTRLKLPQSLSFSEAIAKGHKIFEKKFEKLSVGQTNLFELVINISKSICAHLLELKSLDADDEKAFEGVLKLLSLDNFNENFEQKAQVLLDEFVELDHNLFMKLNELNEERYGKMTPVKVSLSTRPNKAILVSGSNLRELELILEATKDKNIDIYTHGHMINAHAYPYFRKYPHLVGHFGKEIDSHLVDFAAFPGAIFMTKHSFRSLKNLYRSRIYTTDVIAPKGVILIKNNNFEPLIESALSAKGFTKSRTGCYIKINLDEKKILEKISEMIDKIKTGEIKRIFVIGVSNNTKVQKEYFEKFLSLLGNDSFVLSFSYTNKKDNVLLVESDHALPIIFKALHTITEKMNLQDLNLTILFTRCAIYTLSGTIYLKNLGIKNIYFNDCHPTQINPSLVKAFRTMFGLKEYTTPEADLKEILNTENK